MERIPLLFHQENKKIDFDRIVKTLLEKEYGDLPRREKKTETKFLPIAKKDVRFCAGKASLQTAVITSEFETGTVSFPVRICAPQDGKKHPFFVCPDFYDSLPSRYLPAEELIDSGWGLVQLFYEDVTSDENFDAPGQNAAEVILKDSRPETRCGKLRIWAWAVSRALDALQQVPEYSGKAVAAGHSRLGKTALLAAALDDRFSGAVSNDSGCAGAALFRGKTDASEDIEKITRRFPYWFIPSFSAFAGRENELIFDQHFLLAAAAKKKKILVNSAFGDEWAAPAAEYAAVCAAAREMDPDFPDLPFPDQPARIFGSVFGYSVRNGLHSFAREDWHAALEFFRDLL